MQLLRGGEGGFVTNKYEVPGIASAFSNRNELGKFAGQRFWPLLLPNCLCGSRVLKNLFGEGL